MVGACIDQRVLPRLLALQSAEKLQGEGVPADKLYVGDIVKGTEQLKKSLAGADALVIATSAVPQIKPLSLLTVRSSILYAIGGSYSGICGFVLHQDR